MTPATARTVANALVFTAGVAAAYVVLTSPRLRRLAVRAARGWLGGNFPVFVATEVHRAWAASGDRR